VLSLFVFAAVIVANETPRTPKRYVCPFPEEKDSQESLLNALLSLLTKVIQSLLLVLCIS